MANYLLKRTAVALISVLLIMVAIFLIMSYLPGVRVEFTSYYGGDALDRLFEKIGAGDHLLTKLVRYFYNMVAYGNIGASYVGAPDLTKELFTRVSFTLSVATPSFVFAALAGIGFGILAALKQDTWPDLAVSGISMFLASVPPFSLALLLALLFCVRWKILPLFDLDSWRGYVLPIFILGINSAALAARMTRSCILDILSKPFITALQAKGIKDSQILFLHILKNALVPIVSVLNNTAIYLISSTLIIENFFSIPGIGHFLVDAVLARDAYKVLGCAIFLGTSIVLINLVTDILYALLNPRLLTSKKGVKA